MSDSEGSDSDGSYGGRKKLRRDEAEEVTFYQDISFGIINCFVHGHGSLAFNVMLQGEEEDVADEQEPEGEDLAGGDGEDDSDEEVFSCNHVDCGAILCSFCNSKSNIFSQDGRKYKKKGRRANARDFIIDEAEVILTKP